MLAFVLSMDLLGHFVTLFGWRLSRKLPSKWYPYASPNSRHQGLSPSQFINCGSLGREVLLPSLSETAVNLLQGVLPFVTSNAPYLKLDTNMLGLLTRTLHGSLLSVYYWRRNGYIVSPKSWLIGRCHPFPMVASGGLSSGRLRYNIVLWNPGRQQSVHGSSNRFHLSILGTS